MEIKVHRIPRQKCRCSECGQSFPSVMDLEVHMKMDHAKKPDSNKEW